MTEQDDKTTADVSAQPVDLAAAGIIARALWQIEVETRFDSVEARKEAYDLVKKDYTRKARRLLKEIGKRGVFTDVTQI